jgi:hypothetical protein
VLDPVRAGVLALVEELPVAGLACSPMRPIEELPMLGPAGVLDPAVVGPAAVEELPVAGLACSPMRPIEELPMLGPAGVLDPAVVGPAAVEELPVAGPAAVLGGRARSGAGWPLPIVEEPVVGLACSPTRRCRGAARAWPGGRGRRLAGVLDPGPERTERGPGQQPVSHVPGQSARDVSAGRAATASTP